MMIARWMFVLPALVLGGVALRVTAAQSDRVSSPPEVSGVVALFTGKAEDIAANWVRRGTDQPAAWNVESGAMVVGRGDIATKQVFGDFHLHIEFRTPDMPNASGQGKGNSGIGLLGRYEIQVLDSYGIQAPGKGDCGAVYGQASPLVNACKRPMEWQTFDIIFRAPRLGDDGIVVEKPRVTVIQNGIVIQNNVQIEGPTGIQSQREREPSRTGPIVLQDHGNRVEYRNVWILPLPDKGADRY